MNIEEKLLAIVQDMMLSKGPDPQLTISRTTSFRDELGFDSFDLAELTVRIEDLYQVDIFEQDNRVDTVDQVIERIQVHGSVG
ncbi:acyl carrier protein [Paenibacillus lutrae]|uniref:Acyl carrier protein n=1 Tax=Paenibacillus lutrae TaxID=2078573 RepID=A0A7X3FFA2_9BACL|nr:phosphopantetheine-binding protein [Paenibacillus lutrae]MVO98631.1 acyl carrier protein [Paenibacillus lutrae]